MTGSGEKREGKTCERKRILYSVILSGESENSKGGSYHGALTVCKVPEKKELAT